MGDGVIVVAVLVALAMSVRCTLATDYVVGKETCTYGGWDYRCDYTSWALLYTFVPGDNLVFNFDEAHNTVAQVSATDYYDCLTLGSPSSTTATIYYASPTTYPLTFTGSHYYASVVSGNCYQKLAISVTAGSSPTLPPPARTVPSPYIYSPPPPSGQNYSPPPASTGTLKISLVVGGSTTGVIVLVANIIWFYCRRQHQKQNQNQVEVKPQVDVDIGLGN